MDMQPTRTSRRALGAIVVWLAAVGGLSGCDNAPTLAHESLENESSYIETSILDAIDEVGGSDVVVSFASEVRVCEIAPGDFSHDRIGFEVELKREPGLADTISLLLAERDGGTREATSGSVIGWIVTTRAARYSVVTSAGGNVFVQAVTGCYPRSVGGRADPTS